MSFYSYKNANPNCCPGTISGSALDGLQEKVCVQVKRVYDSAMTQEQLTKQTVTITSYAQVNNTCTCNACGYNNDASHSFSYEQIPNNRAAHRVNCSICGYSAVQPHSPDANGYCIRCGSYTGIYPTGAGESEQ